MSKLQELLDARWPLHGNLSTADRLYLESYRLIFTEGYNAAKAEEKEDAESWAGDWDECRQIRDTRGIFDAVKYLRQNGRKEPLVELKDKVLSL